MLPTKLRDTLATKRANLKWQSLNSIEIQASRLKISNVVKRRGKKIDEIHLKRESTCHLKAFFLSLTTIIQRVDPYRKPRKWKSKDHEIEEKIKRPLRETTRCQPVSRPIVRAVRKARGGRGTRTEIARAKQLPTLPVRRGHIFTPENVGRKATAWGMRTTPYRVRVHTRERAP